MPVGFSWSELGRIVRGASHKLEPGFDTSDAREARDALATFDIDHSVAPIGERGGHEAVPGR